MYFYVFCLNNNKKLIKTIRFEGEFSSTINISKTLFAQKIAFEANKAVVIVHTHPNGNHNPTQADIKATKCLINSADSLGIKFDDHVIITNDRYFSFLKSGLLSDLIKDIKINGYKNEYGEIIDENEDDQTEVD